MNSIHPDATILVTGGCGFIGSNLVRYLINETEHSVVNVDALTYAGNPATLADLATHPRYQFVQADISNAEVIHEVVRKVQPSCVMHLAAESHVDRSIDGPVQFMQTNVMGTLHLLQAFRSFYSAATASDQLSMRFLHVSTDEVFGSLGEQGLFDESTAYKPHSPYAASKAASDHVARAWHDTFGVPVVVTNCSNNYGPYQFPEKLIPVVILNAINNRAIPIYGDGMNIRDWLYVGDHVRALYRVLTDGQTGHTYTIGGNNELTNIHLVNQLCAILDTVRPRSDGVSYTEQIEHVQDRPGHDRRYAIDASKIRSELGWEPMEDSKSGLKKTVYWYLDNESWYQPILSQTYELERLGIRT